MMDTMDDDRGVMSTAMDVQSAWQVVNVREGEVTPYFANAYNTKRLSVSKVRADVWAWFPDQTEGGFFPIPITVSKIGVPTRRPHHFAQSFRRMAQKYSRPHRYVEIEVQDVGADEHLFLYWFDPALDVCWAQYGLHQTVQTMILYRRYVGVLMRPMIMTSGGFEPA